MAVGVWGVWVWVSEHASMSSAAVGGVWGAPACAPTCIRPVGGVSGVKMGTTNTVAVTRVVCRSTPRNSAKACQMHVSAYEESWRGVGEVWTPTQTGATTLTRRFHPFAPSPTRVHRLRSSFRPHIRLSRPKDARDGNLTRRAEPAAAMRVRKRSGKASGGVIAPPSAQCARHSNSNSARWGRP